MRLPSTVEIKHLIGLFLYVIVYWLKNMKGHMNTIFGNLKLYKKQESGGRVYRVEFIDRLEISYLTSLSMMT